MRRQVSLSFEKKHSSLSSVDKITFYCNKERQNNKSWPCVNQVDAWYSLASEQSTIIQRREIERKMLFIVSFNSKQTHCIQSRLPLMVKCHRQICIWKSEEREREESGEEKRRTNSRGPREMRREEANEARGPSIELFTLSERQWSCFAIHRLSLDLGWLTLTFNLFLVFFFFFFVWKEAWAPDHGQLCRWTFFFKMDDIVLNINFTLHANTVHCKRWPCDWQERKQQMRKDETRRGRQGEKVKKKERNQERRERASVLCQVWEKTVS